MAERGVVEFSTVLPEDWQPGDPPFTFECCREVVIEAENALTYQPDQPTSEHFENLTTGQLRESVRAVKAELGLTRNGRMRSVLRDSDLWRLMAACVVAGRPVEVRGA